MESGTHSRVVLLYGGWWEHRDESVRSATRVLEALRGGGLSVTLVRWDPDGWVILPGTEEGLLAPGRARNPLAVLRDLREARLGVVFNCLHGGQGADGATQGFLEVSEVPYTGAGVQASAISGDRESFRQMVLSFGYEVPEGGVINREEWFRESNGVLTAVSVEVGLPAIVKGLRSGLASEVVEESAELADSLDRALQQHRRVLVERFATGREFALGCLGTRAGEPPQVLPPLEITSSGPGPVTLDTELDHHFGQLVDVLHRELDLGGASITRVILGADGPLVLDTDTVPEFGDGAPLPIAAEAAGIDFTLLCRRLIDHALSAYLARGADAMYSAGLRGS